MNEIDKNQILKMVLILMGIIGIVGIASYFRQRSILTLDEYARQNGQEYHAANSENSSESTSKTAPTESPEPSGATQKPVSALTGALLNGGSDGQHMIAQRAVYQTASGVTESDFYVEPLSDNLIRYMTGISYPATEASNEPGILPEDLRYLHILHYDLEGNVMEGELICNESIAADLLDIFYELYRNEYRIGHVLLIDEYGGNETASGAADNTFCFYRQAKENNEELSKHAWGLAVDINPCYNPAITYDDQGGIHVIPESAAAYTDRNADFPYKIDENDLCYKLFVKHGFTWGGNRNSGKEYGHFQKAD